MFNHAVPRKRHFDTEDDAVRGCNDAANPLGILPEGNLLLSGNSEVINTRIKGLGNLSRLSDTLLLEFLGWLSPTTIVVLSRCSKALLAFTRHEPLWKDIYLRAANGSLPAWHGNWRKTYACVFGGRSPNSLYITNDSEYGRVNAKGFYSDVLYQPILCANLDVRSYFYLHSSRKKARENIRRHSATVLAVEEFISLYAATSTPVIITDAMRSWPSYTSQCWSPQRLLAMYGDQLFRAEAVDCSLATYLAYANNCPQDESPLYLFDSHFVEKTGEKMELEYAVPEYFSEDLFRYMSDERPNYRWLIVGPARSGSTFHKDPNQTSAWNAVIQGRKGWVMFHPDVPPPGVWVSPDEAEVTSPLSISEWFWSYFNDAWETYGPDSLDPSSRGKMVVGICEAGEIVYVPSGWWHLVVNLDFSIAITQNYVSSMEISKVLAFMRDRPDQVSGFRRQFHHNPSACPSVDTSLYGRFCDALRMNVPTTLENGLQDAEHVAKRELIARVKRDEKNRTLWDVVKMGVLSDNLKESTFEFQNDAPTSGFSFNFDLGMDS